MIIYLLRLEGFKVFQEAYRRGRRDQLKRRNRLFGEGLAKVSGEIRGVPNWKVVLKV